MISHIFLSMAGKLAGHPQKSCASLVLCRFRSARRPFCAVPSVSRRRPPQPHGKRFLCALVARVFFMMCTTRSGVPWRAKSSCAKVRCSTTFPQLARVSLARSEIARCNPSIARHPRVFGYLVMFCTNYSPVQSPQKIFCSLHIETNCFETLNKCE